MAHDGGEGFNGAEEGASSASASPSPDAAGGVLDLAEAKDLGAKNSTASWSGDMAGGEGLIRQSTGDGMELGDAKNPLLGLSEAQNLGVKKSACPGAEEGGMAPATDFSVSSSGGVGFGQPRQDGIMQSNATNAILGQLAAQQHGAEGAMPEVARAPGQKRPSSFRGPSRRRKSLRPTRFIAEEASSVRASAANASSYILDAYLTSQINNALDEMPEVVQNIRADWILDEHANEGFKIRDAKYYAARLRQLHASAAEPAGTSGGNGPSASAGQGSTLPSTSPTEPQEELQKGSEDGGAAPDAAGPRSSRHLAILGASLACAAIMCVLFFIRRN